ncbi:response regulator transcription factor [Pseudomonas sp. LFM046]|uniref:response regulator transcription factor n=1 Tax=Pseudomonas sp. LFM046 TaxID=1608357 RepID=UPI000CCC4020|nr:response regulator transcription factor [Pseudomonas sp. LFM046]
MPSEQLNRPTNVLLVAADQDDGRSTLRQFLTSAGYQCSTCGSGREAVQRFVDNPDIDIVLCDLHAPELDGVRLVDELMQACQAPRVFEAIVFAEQLVQQCAFGALRLGAADYLQRPADPVQILRTIRCLEQRLEQRRQGERERAELNRRMSALARAIDELQTDLGKLNGAADDPSAPAGANPESSLPAPFDRLTQRQQDVARLVGRGMANQTIAGELGLSPNTVKLYVSQIMRITGARNRTQIALDLGRGLPPVRQPGA